MPRELHSEDKLKLVGNFAGTDLWYPILRTVMLSAGWGTPFRGGLAESNRGFFDFAQDDISLGR